MRLHFSALASLLCQYEVLLFDHGVLLLQRVNNLLLQCRLELIPLALPQLIVLRLQYAYPLLKLLNMAQLALMLLLPVRYYLLFMLIKSFIPDFQSLVLCHQPVNRVLHLFHLFLL